MTKRAIWMIVGLVLLGLGLSLSWNEAPGLTVAAHSSENPKPEFNRKGELLRPQGYRQWVYIGTPITPNDLNPPAAPFPDFHNVYIHPVDFQHYQRTGAFRDGTVLVKELVSVGSKTATSGKGYFMGEFTGLEATIKDSARYPDEPGNWAYFSFGHEYPLANAVSPLPTAACNSCHQAAAAEDFVFTQYYPILRAARGGSASKAAASSVSAASAAQTSSNTRPGQSKVPTDKLKLFDFLKQGKYKEFPAKESRNHPSRGPHTRLGLPVRVFLDSQLDASLKAGKASHPSGSVAVKEMYGPDGALQGWAVMSKTETDSRGGQGWFWYEITSTTDPSSPVAAGNGVSLCFGCHSTGRDFVLTDFPLQ